MISFYREEVWDAKGYDVPMKHPRISCFLLAFVLTGVASSQAPLAVGWFDFRDPRSQTTGMRTQLANQSQVISRPFQLGDPRTFKPENYDVIIIGSFSEFHPQWDQFVRREKGRIEQFIRRGGTLVQMCRYRKSDDAGRLSLLPPGFRLNRGKKDIKDDEWYVNYRLEPLWRGFGKDKRNGWNRLPQTKIGPKRLTCGMDAFEQWSKNFVRSSDVSMNSGRRFQKSYSLTADYGRGHLLFFQLVLDKIDNTEDGLAKKQCRMFFATLIAYLKSHPRIAKPEIKTAPKPRPKPKPRDIPVRPKPIRRYRLKGRVFFDDNGNRQYDRNEKAAGAIRLRLGTQAQETRADGSFDFNVNNEIPSQIVVDLPSNAAYDSPWFLNLNAGAAQSGQVSRDIPLLRRKVVASQEGVLVTMLPRNYVDANAALFELGLSQALADSQPELVVFLAPFQDRRQLGELTSRLQRICQTSGVGFRLLAARPKKGAEQFARFKGPSNLVLEALGYRFFLASAPNAASWLRNSSSNLTPASCIYLSAEVLARDVADRLAGGLGGLIVPQSGERIENEGGVMVAPSFLTGSDRDETPAYLLLRSSQGKLQTARFPLPKAPTAVLPAHPWGSGNILDLLDEAGKAK